MMKKIFYGFLCCFTAACTNANKDTGMDNNRDALKTVLNIDMVADKTDAVQWKKIAAGNGASYDGVVVYVTAGDSTKLQKSVAGVAGAHVEPPYNIEPVFIPDWLPQKVKDSFIKNPDNNGTFNTHNDVYELGKLKANASDNGFIINGRSYLLIIVYKV